MSSENKNIKRQPEWIALCRRVVKSGGAKLGAIIFAIILLFCIFGPLFSSYGPNDIDLMSMYGGPTLKHPFGTDALGRDMMARLMYGGRYSILLGIMASFCSAFIGIVLGSIAGYFGGHTETIIMRIMDIWSSLPGMLLCILVSAVMGSGFLSTVLALTVGSIPGGTRMIRGQVLQERSKEYVEAAEAFNCPKYSIMFRHLLPNCIQPMIVMATMSIGSVMIQAASLSYIGLGVQPPTPEWGAMLADGRSYIRTYPHLLLVPGLAIAATVLAINLLGDGLRSALDPKLRD
ncbi:MAG: ABC transporter permease [Lachnospiraceae bacterium]|jgi:ABC-type dipeptide/oligopeptide/nickel transport system permease subunit|nr:ABC transporter permease [Lachnospiraceae bacterium]